MNRKGKNRIVIGHPSCPRVIKTILAALSGLKPSSPTGLILPPVTPGDEECLEAILEMIKDFEDIEITVNDWGALARTAEWKHEYNNKAVLILGILLCGQESDPIIRLYTEPQKSQCVRIGQKVVMLHWAPPPASLLKHWAEPAAFHMTEMLHKLGVDEIEIGLQPIRITETEEHLPVRYVSYGVMSVKPCRRNCEKCEEKEIMRGGARVYCDCNLVKWEELQP